MRYCIPLEMQLIQFRPECRVQRYEDFRYESRGQRYEFIVHIF